jgi:hypothetical protein
MHVVRASLIAPLAGPLLYWVGALGAAFADPGRRSWAGQNLTGGLVLIFAFAAPVAYAATLLLALPALWLMRRAGPLTLGRTVLVGVLVGVGVAAVMGPPLRGELFSAPLSPWAGGLLGAGSSAVWWKLARG